MRWMTQKNIPPTSMKKWDNWDLKRNIHQALSCHAVIYILSNWSASILFCLSLLSLKHKLPPHNWDNWEETCLAPSPARCPSPGASKMPATQHNAATRYARLFLGKPIGRDADALLATASTLSLNFASHSREGGTFSRILHQLISSKKVAAALAGETVLRQLR